MGLEQMYFVKHLANETLPFVIYMLHFQATTGGFGGVYVCGFSASSD